MMTELTSILCHARILEKFSLVDSSARNPVVWTGLPLEKATGGNRFLGNQIADENWMKHLRIMLSIAVSWFHQAAKVIATRNEHP